MDAREYQGHVRQYILEFNILFSRAPRLFGLAACTPLFVLIRRRAAARARGGPCATRVSACRPGARAARQRRPGGGRGKKAVFSTHTCFRKSITLPFITSGGALEASYCVRHSAPSSLRSAVCTRGERDLRHGPSGSDQADDHRPSRACVPAPADRCTALRPRQGSSERAQSELRASSERAQSELSPRRLRPRCRSSASSQRA